MKEEQDQINELYRKILHGSAQAGDKEKLARWMARLDVGRNEASAEELAEEQHQSQRELNDRFFRQQKQLPFARIWLVAASVAAVVFCSVFFYKINAGRNTDTQFAITYTKNSTAAGERKTITLQDGSKIWLNSSSNIRYAASFTGQKREIFMEGQAYFQVAHDKTRPFIVHTEKLAVQVLGTTFDVRSYKEDQDAAVTVAAGKVAVKIGTKSAQYMLTPGGQLIYDRKTGAVKQFTVDPAEFTAWQNGALIFRSTELKEICRQLERAYGVTILINTRVLEKRKLNFRVKNENITKVMEMLSTAGSFQYSVKDRTISLWK